MNHFNWRSSDLHFFNLYGLPQLETFFQLRPKNFEKGKKKGIEDHTGPYIGNRGRLTRTYSGSCSDCIKKITGTFWEQWSRSLKNKTSWCFKKLIQLLGTGGAIPSFYRGWQDSLKEICLVYQGDCYCTLHFIMDKIKTFILHSYRLERENSATVFKTIKSYWG